MNWGTPTAWDTVPIPPVSCTFPTNSKRPIRRGSPSVRSAPSSGPSLGSFNGGKSGGRAGTCTMKREPKKKRTRTAWRTQPGGGLYTLEAFIIGGPIAKKFARKNKVISRIVQIRGDQTMANLHHILFTAFDHEEEHCTSSRSEAKSRWIQKPGTMSCR